MSKEPSNPPPGKSGGLLTMCQVEVLCCLRSGLRPAQVAARLHCSEATVRMHIRRANARLDTHSYYASILIAERLGILGGRPT